MTPEQARRHIEAIATALIAGDLSGARTLIAALDPEEVRSLVLLTAAGLAGELVDGVNPAIVLDVMRARLLAGAEGS